MELSLLELTSVITSVNKIDCKNNSKNYTGRAVSGPLSNQSCRVASLLADHLAGLAKVR